MQTKGWVTLSCWVGLAMLAFGITPAAAQATYEYDNVTGRLSRIINQSDGTVVEYHYDANGNRTESIRSTDASAPSSPSGLFATVISQSRIDLSWSASTDNIAVSGYRILRCTGANCSNYANIGTDTASPYSDTGVAGGTTYGYCVRAFDAAQNQSACATVSATTPDVTAPSAPGTPTFNNITMTTAVANWTAATDDIGVTGYEYRLNANAWQPLGNQLSVSLSGLAPVTTYTFQVRAFDAGNNRGSASSANFTTPDTAAPSAPGTPIFSNIVGTSATVTWTAASDNVAVTNYEYRINNGAWISAGNVLSVSLTGLTSGTTHTVDVRAKDAANNTGAVASASFTTPDSIAPSIPTNLLGSSTTSSAVNLSWTASTDNVAVTGYRVYRNSVHIASPSSNSYTDNSTSGTTTYAYRVSARDAAGNESAQSSPVNVTTPDTLAPTTPTLQSATASNGSTVNLAWSQSTDPGGSGIAGYRIYRNGSHITNAPGASTTTFSDTTATPGGTYS
ncbi:MAG TPA: fibronectin type III domain-containing protein, partial [Steroidobacter sp.]